ncbi:MAG: hypothetical protein ACOCW1_03440 [Chitinispirillaceae bacterium]
MKQSVHSFIICIILLTSCSLERSGTETGNPLTAPGDSGSPKLSPPAFTVPDSLEVNVYDSLTINVEGENIDSVIFSWAPNGLDFSDTVRQPTFHMVFSDSGQTAVPVKAVYADNVESEPDTIIVTVKLDPPVITKKQDTTVNFEDIREVRVQVSASDTNATGSIEKYYWDKGADGWDDSTETPFYTVGSNDSEDITLRWAARDDDGLFTEDTFNIFLEKPAQQSFVTDRHLQNAAVPEGSSKIFIETAKRDKLEQVRQTADGWGYTSEIEHELSESVSD